MEHPRKKIESLIFQIILLLELGEENYWLKYFKYILTNLDSKNNQKEAVALLDQAFKGGMGSFSDVVLHKNGIPLIEENNKLEILKDELFDASECFLKNQL